MATIVKKSLNRPEETQTPEKLRIEIVTIDGFQYSASHGGARVAMVKTHKAARWS